MEQVHIVAHTAKGSIRPQFHCQSPNFCIGEFFHLTCLGSEGFFHFHVPAIAVHPCNLNCSGTGFEIYGCVSCRLGSCSAIYIDTAIICFGIGTVVVCTHQNIDALEGMEQVE